MHHVIDDTMAWEEMIINAGNAAYLGGRAGRNAESTMAHHPGALMNRLVVHYFITIKGSH